MKHRDVHAHYHRRVAGGRSLGWMLTVSVDGVTQAPQRVHWRLTELRYQGLVVKRWLRAGDRL
jgi:hypothetical protein